MTDTFRDLIIRASKDKEEAEFRTALHEALTEFARYKNEKGKMSDDLVKRLREEWMGMQPPSMCLEAADRIEKLETALREIVDRAEHRMGHAVSDDVCAIARKALEGKDD